VKILRRADYRRMPWKNGGGTTEEIAREPAEGAGFRWRLSLASIGQSGPFSDFAGYMRVMLLLNGAGLVLRSPGEADRVLHERGDCVQFDGALAIQCTLHDGPCEDLNLMVDKREAFRARVEDLRVGLMFEPARGETLIAVPLDGARLTLASGSAVLGAADTLLLEQGEQARLEALPGAGSTRVFVAGVSAG
jgi:uncharacterized protein